MRKFKFLRLIVRESAETDLQVRNRLRKGAREMELFGLLIKKRRLFTESKIRVSEDIAIPILS